MDETQWTKTCKPITTSVKPLCFRLPGTPRGVGETQPHLGLLCLGNGLEIGLDFNHMAFLVLHHLCHRQHEARMLDANGLIRSETAEV